MTELPTETAGPAAGGHHEYLDKCNTRLALAFSDGYRTNCGSGRLRRRGPGVIPWQIDYAQLEEDVFLRGVAARGSLSIEGCHRLARQFRQRIEVHDAQAVALTGINRACPFDLQVLLPIPGEILRRGPADPESLDWLARHWGTRDAFRRIVERPNPSIGRRLPAGHGVVSYGFFTSGDTPRAAIATIGARWPALRFVLTPRPPD